jgi:putative membrane-bound dehydrogenase-like protein
MLLIGWFVSFSIVPNESLAQPAGIRPIGTDGKPLNLDFETGTLKDWLAEGEAFRDQPIKGDTVFERRGDMRSGHQGHYWIGGYERLQDKPQGTLTSVPFKVTHPWASFRVGGGPHTETCVELVQKDSDQVIFRVSGMEEENLRLIEVDLRKQQGKEICIRLVDRHSGHWGHINFDDFRFHAEQPKVPPRPTAVTPDVYKHAGLSPNKAAAAMTVPEGFTVTLFAGEPDVHQPIGFCLDDRGRLWVAEAYIYPVRHPHPGPVLPDNEKAKGDRILIFEDANGDGKFDKRSVFMEGLNLVSGLEYGFGGIWVGAAPYLLFIPDKDRDDKPDGPPQILLDGWGYEDTHETLNSFIWGPDGWLYGCHGVFTHSRVGKPGTSDDKRVPINAGVWRYHPTRHEFEVFAHGTSNPWGLDFNDYGDAFIEACVIPHAFHIVQGGRYHRQAGAHFNPHTYADIQTIADHLHYVGGNPHGGNNRSDTAGGGHAHCGLMIYLGGTWPKEYHGQMFMGNIHGRRINMDKLTPKGSGYVASHGPDFLLANDAYARFINLRYGPDGNVYLIDWYDKQACHHTDAKIWDRTNGRIYKISYRGTKPVSVDLSKQRYDELVEMQLHPNDWYVRHARRILQERYAENPRADDWRDARIQLGAIIETHEEDRLRLRALWTLNVLGVWSYRGPEVSKPTRHPVAPLHADRNPSVRAWLIRLRERWYTTNPDFPHKHSSPASRLAMASALQRIPPEGRHKALAELLTHEEDAADPNLPLMYWYAAEPLAEDDPKAALELTAKGRIPLVTEFTARRVASLGTPKALAVLAEAVGATEDEARLLRLLRGMQAGLRGRNGLSMPQEWPALYGRLSKRENAEIRSLALSVAVLLGDPNGLDAMRATLAADDAPLNQRQAALDTLVQVKDPKLAPVLHRLIGDAALRGPALRALAGYDDSKTPEVILAAYGSFGPAEKRDALATLASRPAYAKALLDAVGARKIAVADVPADLVRQLRNLGDTEVEKRIAEVWGIVRDTPAERAKLMKAYHKIVTRPGKPPDIAAGRALYAKTCQQCHILFGVGGKVGPDITGANRGDLNYLLENVLDPGAVIPKEYAVTLIELKNGRVITGIVREETPTAVTVVTADETLTIPRTDIESSRPTDQSMMPDDQLKPFSDAEVRALFAYLQSPVQTPILATADNAKDFFNGKDLTGWDGDPKLWKVENGEIVGKSPGLKKNDFLRSHMVAGDFRLSLKVKLTPNTENSGIQFRSEALPGGDVKGLQADIGAGWWGKLYEEHGRGLLWDKSGEPHVKPGDWNDYVIEANGPRIRTWINGNLCVDLDDPKAARRGIFALQIHSGGPLEVRFKDLRLEAEAQRGD